MFYLKITKKQNFTAKYSSLVGRIISSPQFLSANDIKEILRTALELRHLFSKNTKLDVIKGVKVLFVLVNPSIYLTLPVIRACEILNVKLNVIIDPTWDTRGFMTDTMKVLQSSSDIILVQSRFQCNLDAVKNMKNMKIPMFCVQSMRFKTCQSLANFMTFNMKYGPLRGLKIAWLGPPNAMLNTYLSLGPKLGVNISYYCSLNSHAVQSPAMLQVAQQIRDSSKTILEECPNLQSTLKGAKVIATSDCEDSDITLTSDMLKYAGEDSSVIFELPRGIRQIEPGLIDEERCITWNAFSNNTWIYTALLVKLLHAYNYSTEMPKFE